MLLTEIPTLDELLHAHRAELGDDSCGLQESHVPRGESLNDLATTSTGWRT